MAKFFNYFPKTFYSNNFDSNSLDTVTNIIARFGFESSLKNNSSAFYKYEIQEGDTPEIIAHKYYGHSERHWIVLLFNNIIDPQFDWPLTDRQLVDYVDKKYSANNYADTANTSVSGISYAKNEDSVYAYYKTVTQRSNFYNTTTVEEFVVDFTTYDAIIPQNIDYTLDNGQSINETITKRTESYYTYEQRINEDKRKINLLKKDFVPAVEKEFKRVIKG
jgi:uncharacterized iron-regulated protein